MILSRNVCSIFKLCISHVLLIRKYDLSRPSAEEEARAGLRRGRSAAAVVLPERDETGDPRETPASSPAESDPHGLDQPSEDGDGSDDGAGEDTYHPTRPDMPLQPSESDHLWERDIGQLPMVPPGRAVAHPPELPMQAAFAPSPIGINWTYNRDQASFPFSGQRLPQAHPDCRPQVCKHSGVVCKSHC
jgi:hypothetical protein